MLCATGYWPTQIEFDYRDLATVATILEKRNK